VTGADPSFFCQLPLRGLEGWLVGLEFPGGQLPDPAVGYISVLPQEAYAPLGIEGDDAGAARVVDDLERRSMSIGKDDVIGGDRNDPPAKVNSLVFRFHTRRVCGSFA
jgi:hypothetical protein